MPLDVEVDSPSVMIDIQQAMPPYPLTELAVGFGSRALPSRQTRFTPLLDWVLRFHWNSAIVYVTIVPQIREQCNNSIHPVNAEPSCRVKLEGKIIFVFTPSK